MTEDRYTQARQNAKAWAREIIGEWQKHKEADGYDEEHNASQRQRLEEMPLSILVRSGWYEPGSGADKQQEYQILLSTGGPALRIRGELDNYGEPNNARLEMQDWGVPWQEATGMVPCADLDILARLNYYGELDAALLWFASHFYYGEWETMKLQERSILAIQKLLIEIEACEEVLNHRSFYRKTTRDETIAYARRVVREYDNARKAIAETE